MTTDLVPLYGPSRADLVSRIRSSGVIMFHGSLPAPDLVSWPVPCIGGVHPHINLGPGGMIQKTTLPTINRVIHMWDIYRTGKFAQSPDLGLNGANVVIGRPPEIMSKCTVQRQSANRILVQNVSRDDVDPLPPFTPLIHDNRLQREPYFPFRCYSDMDDGSILNQKLLSAPSTLVVDGSYDRYDDSGAASFIWECSDSSSRVSNATLVPSNVRTLSRWWSDPYRCELFSLLLALMTIHDMESRFQAKYKEITIAVDNDTALDMALIFTTKV